MIEILISLALFVNMLRLKNKFDSFTRKGEVRFWSTYIKQDQEKQALEETKNTITHAFANYSWWHKVMYWTERIFVEGGYYGGIILWLIVIVFRLNRRIEIIALAMLLLAVIFHILFFNQIYYFWKKQPIWHERPVAEQPFLLPTEQDFKILNKYFIQMMGSLGIILVIGIHLLS